MKNLISRISGFLRKDEKKMEQVMYLSATSLVLAMILGVATTLEPGWFTWALALPAHLIIIVTALARVKDLKEMNLRSQVRRIGLVLSGAGSVVFMMAPFVDSIGDFPTWKALLLVWGVAFTWLTTPNHPPWWKYITGEFRELAKQD